MPKIVRVLKTCKSFGIFCFVRRSRGSLVSAWSHKKCFSDQSIRNIQGALLVTQFYFNLDFEKTQLQNKIYQSSDRALIIINPFLCYCLDVPKCEILVDFEFNQSWIKILVFFFFLVRRCCIVQHVEVGQTRTFS